MLGIFIGVTAVIVIVGLGNGMEDYMTDSFSSLGANTLTVQITGPRFLPQRIRGGYLRHRGGTPGPAGHGIPYSFHAGGCKSRNGGVGFHQRDRRE